MDGEYRLENVPGGDPGDYHPLAKMGRLRQQDETKFRLILLLLPRLIGIRTLEMVLFLCSLRGGRLERYIEELLQRQLGGRMAASKYPIFVAEEGGGQSNSAVSLGREGARALFGQDVNWRRKLPNAVSRRRAAAGRKGGGPEVSKRLA